MQYLVMLDRRGDGVEVAAESFKETELGLQLWDTNGKLVASFRDYVGIIPSDNKEEI